MQGKDFFSNYHPIVNFLYFGFVIGFSMVFVHPVCLAISLLCSVIYHIYLNTKKSARFILGYGVPMLVVTAVVNVAFNHQGSIILCYLPTGNPLTLESILYGFACGIMLISVLLWFFCYSSVMTSDKFVYLFGKIVPSLSLLLSMVLRFVPKFIQQFENVKEIQQCIGQSMTNGSILKRFKCAVKCFSIMVTWSLENAIDTADSMKSRGYGLKGRTAFSIYQFTKSDKIALGWICFCAICIISAGITGKMHWTYFPNMDGAKLSIESLCFYAVYFALCITPIYINLREERKWKSLKSKI